MTQMLIPIDLQIQKQNFESLSSKLFSSLASNESLSLELRGEQSLFVRFNNSKVRQIGEVQDFVLTVSFYTNGKFLQKQIPLPDADTAPTLLQTLRDETKSLLLDPFAVLPTATDRSEVRLKGSAQSWPSSLEDITTALPGKKLTGILACGPLVRASANSCGAKHWFESDRVTFDYSLLTESNRMATSCYAATAWNAADFKRHVEETYFNQTILEKPARAVTPGSYRVYLAPAAMESFLALMSYGTFSEAALRQGQSAFDRLKKGEKAFSSDITIGEDFSPNTVPRFNGDGEVAPLTLPLIQNGRFANALVNSRTAKEYDLPSNAANTEESPRALTMTGGALQHNQILKTLGTGLWLSNLHYLNWSDRLNARVTGMTRFACAWVENGEPIGPLQKDLRFDVSLFDILGEHLVALTQDVRLCPDIMTYSGRECGGIRVPGAIISNFTFTL